MKTIEELRIDKRHLEKEIFEAVKKFKEETNCEIEAIHLITVDAVVGSKLPLVVGIKIVTDI